MIEQVRLRSGLRSNQFFNNEQIAGFLSDAYSDIRDKFGVKFQGWFSDTQAFTLTGGIGQNTFDLSTVEDLELVLGVDYVDASGNHYTVPELASFAERNALNGAFPVGYVGPTFNGAAPAGQRYQLLGNTLSILPPTSSGGNYQLIYMPMALKLAEPVTTEFDIDPLDQMQDSGTELRIALANADFEASDVGGTVTIDWGTPNESFSGTYPIATVLSSTFIGTGLPFPAGSFTNPATGTASKTVQPADTVPELPQLMTPWSEYLVILASIAVRTGREKGISDLEARLIPLEARITTMAKQRSQGVKRAPKTGAYGWGGSWGGGYGPGW